MDGDIWSRMDPLARQGMVDELNAMGVYPSYGTVDIFSGKMPTWTNNLFNADKAGGDSALTIGLTRGTIERAVRWTPVLAILAAIVAAVLIGRRMGK